MKAENGSGSTMNGSEAAMNGSDNTVGAVIGGGGESTGMNEPAHAGPHHRRHEIGGLESLVGHSFRGIPGKLFLGETLALTGCEVSLNRLPAGTAMPFVHAHAQNEEFYLFLSGDGTFFIDGQEFPVREGTAIRVDPAGERSWKAGASDLVFLCIQTKAGSLAQATLEDGRICTTRAPWMEGA